MSRALFTTQVLPRGGAGTRWLITGEVEGCWCFTGIGRIVDRTRLRAGISPLSAGLAVGRLVAT